MIRVLMVGNHPTNKGGMTSVINQIGEHDWKSDGVEIVFIPTFIPGNSIIKILYFCVAYIKILWTMLFSRPDIVHMHMSYKGSFIRKYLIHKLCRLFSIKDIIHLHGSEFEKWFNLSDKKMQRKIVELVSSCSCVIVLGKKWKQVIKKISPEANVVVIKNAVQIPEETVKWSIDRVQLLFLGVLIKRKGLSVLIEAINDLPLETKQKIKLVIAGSGEEEAAIRRTVSKYGLEKKVEFAGWVSSDKKRQYLLDSQVMVLPSFNEGLPISILEALSYGMPVIATDVGDVSSAVINGKDGILVKPGDPKELREAIISICNEKRFEEMSLEAREIAENEFSLDIFYRNIRNCYQEI